MKTKLLRAVIACWLALSILVIPSALSQTTSSAQLEMLRSLGPSEREAILRQLGLGSSDLPAANSTGAGKEEIRPTRDSKKRSDTDQEIDPLLEAFPRLKPDDTVVVEVSFKKPEVDLSKVDESKAQSAARVAPVAGSVDAGTAKKPLEADEQERLEKIIDLIEKGNPYTLDRMGVLRLPSVPPVALLGLTEEQASLRLTVDPQLRGLTLKLTRLPVARIDVTSLKPFGYDLFEDGPSTFAPVTDVPVPADFVIGTGDQLQVQLYGSQNRNYRLVVNRDGRINFPDLGPITVAGQTFDAVRAEIERRVGEQMIGTRASVSVGDVRSIRVFVLGEANTPGSYLVSGLSTITSALYAAGGISKTGSLRTIQLKRQGSVIRQLDLYDLLLRGDSSNDAKLASGDVIFIPPLGPTVAVEGEVRRPAIYELGPDRRIESVIGFAGGLNPEADSRNLSVLRLAEDQQRRALSLSLAAPEGRHQTLQNGDRVRVPRLRPTLDSGVVLEGHVYRSGVLAWREGLRLTDVIGSVDELQPNADLTYVIVRRELLPDRRVSILSADLAAALRQRGSEADLALMPRDRIIVLNADEGRRPVVDPLLKEMQLQAVLGKPAEIIRVEGRVKSPGDYPLEPDMRVSDLLRAGGRADESAYARTAELTRYEIVGDERRVILLEVDLQAILSGDATADIALMPSDVLLVRELPEWSRQASITLKGEVRFPGTYPIRRGETLRTVLERAGGVTSLAFVHGAVFSRKDLREREEQQAEELARRLQRDLVGSALQAGQAIQSVQGQATGAIEAARAAQGLLDQLKSTRPAGRMVIDLDRIIAGRTGSQDDVLLSDGDELVIPRLRQEVTVIGEVQNSTSHLFRAGLSRNDYVSLSGGITAKADKGRIYVVRANGSVEAGSGGWFGRRGSTVVEPGDVIVVPLDVERLPPLPLWQAITNIIYNSAVALAAINSF
jgi:polysaccharide export outer membrane protein